MIGLSHEDLGGFSSAVENRLVETLLYAALKLLANGFSE
jgi:hypothetical protein